MTVAQNEEVIERFLLENSSAGDYLSLPYINLNILITLAFLDTVRQVRHAVVYSSGKGID